MTTTNNRRNLDGTNPRPVQDQFWNSAGYVPRNSQNPELNLATPSAPLDESGLAADRRRAEELELMALRRLAELELAELGQLGNDENGTPGQGAQPVVIEVDGNLVEFPNVETATRFMRARPATQQSDPVGQAQMRVVTGQPHRSQPLRPWDQYRPEGSSHPMPQQEEMHSALGEAQQAQVPDHIGGMSGAAADGILFGAGDEYLAGLSSVLGVQPDGEGGANWFDYSQPMGDRYSMALEQIRTEQDSYQTQHPARALGAEVGGAVFTGLLSGGQSAATTGPGLLSRMTRGATTGGLLGGLYGFNEGEGDIHQRVEEGINLAPWSAGVGAALPVVGSPIRSYLNSRTTRNALSSAGGDAPSTNALREMGSELYSQIDDAGVTVGAPAYRNMASGLLREMSETGLDETTGMRHATDLLMLDARDLRIAARVRRPGFADRYPYKFTIRSQVPSGAETELSKIVNGKGDWMFYGHASTSGSGLDMWWLIDLRSFRAGLIRQARNGARIHCGDKVNADGTRFKWFDIRSFPKHPPLVVAASGPL